MNKILIIIVKMVRNFYKFITLNVFESHPEIMKCIVFDENGNYLEKIIEKEKEKTSSGFVLYEDCIKYFKMSIEEINNIKDDYQRKVAFRCIETVYEISETETEVIMGLTIQILLIVFGVVIRTII